MRDGKAVGHYALEVLVRVPGSEAVHRVAEIRVPIYVAGGFDPFLRIDLSDAVEKMRKAVE